MKIVVLLFGLLLSAAALGGVLLSPTSLESLDYSEELLAGDYHGDIPTPASLLDFEVGQRAATPEQIVTAARAWSESSDRARLVEYARSHEGRPLVYLIISSPANLARVDEIQSDLARLANPENLSGNAADQIIESLPGVAWMAYSIHGNESSGADAALAAIYHLVADQSEQTASLLDELVILIDPAMNPDGRARFTSALQQSRGAAPNIDDQSLLHTQSWPYGRTNHYLFDLNRDFIYLTQPETRGRVAAINRWHPQLMIDGHEMGAQDTYLFGPARTPINSNIAPFSREWAVRFSRDQAAAFDARGWPYYTGEWFENLYAGYSNYAEYRGAVHILYEQARMAEDGVRRRDGSVLTYQQSVHHQLASTLANLETLAENHEQLYRQRLQDRRAVLSSDSPYPDGSYLIGHNGNEQRMSRFRDALDQQNIRYRVVADETTISDAVNRLGESGQQATLMPGSLVIPMRQPEARLLHAMLEFDTEIPEAVLLEERQKTLRDGSSLMYDITAWNLPMMFDLPGWQVMRTVSAGEAPAQSGTSDSETVAWQANRDNPPLAWMFSGTDDASVGVAARLMEQGYTVRVLDREASLDGQEFARGTVVVSRNDNRGRIDALMDSLEQVSSTLEIHPARLGAGQGAGDEPDIGGRHFRLLTRPQIAILSHAGTNPNDFGATWYTIDRQLGIRHSHLDSSLLSFADLRRYNVVVMPDRWRGELQSSELKALERWVQAGGTLIAFDGAIPALTDPENGISQVRRLGDSFESIDDYTLALQREWMAGRQQLQPALEQVRDHRLSAVLDYPWEAVDKAPSAEDLERRDEWQSLFMPSGAMAAARVDEEHWLSFGSSGFQPVLMGNAPLLMSAAESDAVLRFGVYREGSQGDQTSTWSRIAASLGSEDDSGTEDAVRLGWSVVPPGQTVYLRMSGLLWPEAGQRMVNTAYLTRESSGRGQIILFANQPNFRGATLGTSRLFLNALVYGPGLGASTPISP